METKDQVTKLQLKIEELELEIKNLHETVTFLTLNYSEEVQRHLNPLK